MKRHYIYILLVFIISCKIQPDSNRDYDKFDPDKTYNLQLNPAPGSAYYYDITTETEINLEVDGQKTENISRTNSGINYIISKDSTGDFLFSMQFDKIHLYTKNKDAEREMDAANSATSIDPAEKMLGILLEANIVAAINASGEIKNISGYKDLGDKIMANVTIEDVNAKVMLQNQWEKLVGGSLIRKNFDQLFKIFPDSAVHLRDTWKLTSKQEGDFNLIVKNIYTLKAINSDIAIIESRGNITGDNTSAGLAGVGISAVTDLKGEQQGEYEMETKTGMLIGCRIKASIDGTIQMMGREIPVKITSTVKMNGKKVK